MSRDYYLDLIAEEIGRCFGRLEAYRYRFDSVKELKEFFPQLKSRRLFLEGLEQVLRELRKWPDGDPTLVLMWQCPKAQ